MADPNSPQALRSSLDLGRRVRDQRVHLGLTQAQVAAQAGLTQPAVSRAERGLSLGSLEQLLALLNTLGLELTLRPADQPPAGGNVPVS